MKEWLYPHELSLNDFISLVSGSGGPSPVYKVIKIGKMVEVKDMVRNHDRPFYLYHGVGVEKLDEEEALARILQGTN